MGKKQDGSASLLVARHHDDIIISLVVHHDWRINPSLFLYYALPDRCLTIRAAERGIALITVF
jgi:hypothetical protein